MSIKPAIDELEQINAEIARNNARNKQLRQRTKVLEQQIAQFLETQATGGVKYNGLSVVLETKNHRPIKCKEAKKEAIHEFFSELGVQDPTQAYERFQQVQRKEEYVTKQKICIKKYDNN
jgi:hypothetical protein